MQNSYIKLLLLSFLTVLSMVGIHAQELLNPMPLEISQGRKKPLDIRKGFSVTDVQGVFTDELAFLSSIENGVSVKVDYGEKVSMKRHVAQTRGSYSLNITGKGIMVTGYDQTGAYNGIVTLRQLLKDAQGSLRCVDIKDSPSVQDRGVMETFACSPREHVDRLRRIDEYALSKVNMYFYAPEDDPVRGKEGWKYPYQSEDMERLKELIAACDKNHMEFVWTIAPGSGYHDTEDDYKFLLNKLVLMYFSGIRSFALITDGAEFRSDIRERLQKDFVDSRRDKPSLYMTDDFCVHLIGGHRQDSTLLNLGPKAFNDLKAEAKVLLRMDELSSVNKFETFCAIDWCWNPAGYDPDVSWRRSIARYVPEVYDTFSKFLIYSDDTGSTESMMAKTFALEDFDKETARALSSEFELLQSMSDSLEKCRDRALLKEIEPWIVQMQNLGKRGVQIIECMNNYMASDQIAFLKSYVSTTMTEEMRREFSAHKVGTLRLFPFCETISQELASGFYKGMNGAVIVKSQQPSDDRTSANALDGNLATFMVCDGRTVFHVPSDASRCHLLLGEQKGIVLFRQLSREGKLLAELLVRNPYIEMEIKPGAVTVDLLGEVELFETIFVK